MAATHRRILRWLTGALVAGGAVLGTGMASAAPPDSPSAAALRASFARLTPQLQRNQFQRALHLDSTESTSELKGDIHALVDYPFATVNAALNDPVKGPAHWCDVLMLHLNIKYCRADKDGTGSRIAVNIGKKVYQSLQDSHRVEFRYSVTASERDYFAIKLNAEKGPMSTHDYRILLEAIPAEGGRTFLHFTYAYNFRLTGRLAMKTYLATIGRNKVGFTITGHGTQGQPVYIEGVRGVVERNAMRYYLAIDAYLSALSAPRGEQLEKRLQGWFNATEQYSRQLHEVDRGAYLDMKRDEHRRQQADR